MLLRFLDVIFSCKIFNKLNIISSVSEVKKNRRIWTRNFRLSKCDKAPSMAIVCFPSRS